MTASSAALTICAYSDIGWSMYLIAMDLAVSSWALRRDTVAMVVCEVCLVCEWGFVACFEGVIRWK